MPAARLLARHQSDRAAGRAVVTVFAGPPAAASRAWAAWAAAVNRPVVIARGPGGVAAAAVEFLSQSAAARAAAAAWAGGPPPAGATARDFAVWWAGRPAAFDPAPAAAAARWLLAPPELRTDPPTAAGLADVVGPHLLPAVFTTADDPPAAVRAALAVAETCPALPVAVAVPDAAVEALTAGVSRLSAAAREGLVRVAGPAADAVRSRFAPTPVPDPVVQFLTKAAASDAVLDAAVVVAKLPTPPTDDASALVFRSAAEKLLYEALADDPATAGLFAPNQPLTFRHGNKWAEADLLCAEWKVAIELDGWYYHATVQDAYRRDRRKDWEYQRHGYLVLRFLSEDVFPDLEGVTTAVKAAVAHRREAPR